MHIWYIVENSKTWTYWVRMLEIGILYYRAQIYMTQGFWKISLEFHQFWWKIENNNNDEYEVPGTGNGN